MMQLYKLKSGYWLAVAVLFVLVFGYSAYKLTESPPTWFDEGVYIQVAQSLAHSGTQAIQTAPGVFVPTGQVTGGYPFLAPVALSLKLFGDNLLATRLPMVLFILLCAGAAFGLIYRLFGPREALFSLLLLATFPLLYGNGKNVLGEVPGMLYTFLALYFLWQVERYEYGDTRSYVLAGLCIGLAAATKPIFFLLPVAVGVVFLLQMRSIPLRWNKILLAAVATLVPLLLWAYLQFGGADALSAVLFHYANPYAETSLAHTILGNFLRFFKEATPIYCAALVALWTAAIGIRAYAKEKITSAEWVAFVFSILVLLAFLRTEGWYRYFFEAMLTALIFAPSSLRIVAQAIGEKFPKINSLARLAPLVLLLLAAIQLYQLNYTSWVATHYSSTEDQTLVAYFAAHPGQGSVLVYNAPEIVPLLHTKNYYQYFDIDPAGALSLGAGNLPLLAQGVPDEVVTTSDVYQQHTALFARYTESDTVGGYLVLARR